MSVIRALLERAPVYRAIAAYGALVCGSLSVLSAAAIYLQNEARLTIGRPIHSRHFALIWIDVFILSLFAHAFFLWREARKAGRPFISPEMKLALRPIVPHLLIPMAFTGWFLTTGYLGAQDLTLVVIWIAFYGLALLSTSVFAPRSIVLLGWAFLLTALSVPVATEIIERYFSFNVPNVLMGTTFGLYHLVYALCTWPRGETDLRPDSPVS